MNAINEALKRQMLIINKLQQAKIPLTADILISHLENESLIDGFSYPEERKSRMRLLQRDIKAIAVTFNITIVKSGKYSYVIADREKWPVNYGRLFDDFDLLTAVNPDSYVNRHIIPEHSRNRGSHYLRPILLAIKDKFIVEFDYVNYRAGGRERHHRLAPHYLKEDQGLWYVVGYENGKLILFGLDRIKNLELTDDTFKFDESLNNLEEIFKDSYGIWADPAIPTEEIELRYDALDGSFLKARPLHPSQKIITDNAEEFRITVQLKITNDFVMALLSRARSLEVVRPAHLRERIRATLADALARHS